ncbi:DUF2971 domain-containing protein [Halpernia frigidisoli]|uniref:DUF2971 domain-containing protein n=1 Tax=Halpernia frigidisoli TaxID=1125876 RepID=A0A1I3FJ50_9FLAO|nr:DUF2971 domain-containing protein [Halpernia frigidisoli]SFI11132.1 Protein of unknown function [Halpernia frigidisoli]
MSKFYKYRGNVDLQSIDGKKLLDRDVESIYYSYMWFSDLESLNDKNEGLHSLDKFKDNVDGVTKLMDVLNLKKHDDEVNNDYLMAVKNAINLHKKLVGIFSLTTDNLNNLMWSHYANCHKGYCIEYEFNKLADLKLNELNCSSLKDFDSFEKVIYDNKIFELTDVNFSPKDFKKIIIRKTKEWSYEKEFRIISKVCGSYQHEPTIIKSIVFGISSSEDVKTYIMEKLQYKEIEFFQLRREKYNSLKFIREKINFSI